MAGDKKAFDAFYWLYVDKLFRYFSKRTSSRFQAEELTQLTFIKFWEYRSSLSPELSADVQVFHKARITYIDWLRKEAAQRNLLSNILNQNDAEAHLPVNDPQKYERAQRALAQLPRMRKKAIILFYLDGYTYKEIADMLDISVKTVDNHIYQGIAQLRKILLFFLLFFSMQ